MARTVDRKQEFQIGDPASVLDAVLSHSSVCMKLIDLDGRIIRWSPGCEALHGWTAEEAVGKVMPHIEEDKRATLIGLLRKVAASGEPIERQSTVVNSDGWNINVVQTIIPVADEGGHAAGVLTLTRDAMSSQVDEALSEQFSLFVKRTLAEPLGAIANAATLLARTGVAEDAERRAELLSTITRIAQGVLVQVDDFRISTANQGEQIVLDREDVDVGNLVADVAAALGVGSHRIMVDFDSHGTTVPADRLRVTRALAVLLRCAILLVEPGESVYASVGRHDRDVTVDITYKGIHPGGDSLSDRALRVQRNGENTAVHELWTGLRFVHAVVEAHGGYSRITSDMDGNVVMGISIREGARATSDGSDDGAAI